MWIEDARNSVIGRRGRVAQASSQKYPTQENEYSCDPANDYSPLHLVLFRHRPLCRFLAKELPDSSCADNRNRENYDSEAKRRNVDCDAAYARAGAPGTPIDLGSHYRVISSVCSCLRSE